MYNYKENKLEVDLLPPYGQSEVKMAGDVALAIGLIIGLGIVLRYLE